MVQIMLKYVTATVICNKSYKMSSPVPHLRFFNQLQPSNTIALPGTPPSLVQQYFAPLLEHSKQPLDGVALQQPTVSAKWSLQQETHMHTTPHTAWGSTNLLDKVQIQKEVLYLTNLCLKCICYLNEI